MQRQYQRARSGTVTGADNISSEHRVLSSSASPSVPLMEARVHAIRTFSLGTPKPFDADNDPTQHRTTQPASWQVPPPTQEPQQRFSGLYESHDSGYTYITPSPKASALRRNTIGGGQGHVRPKVVTTGLMTLSTASPTSATGVKKGISKSQTEGHVPVDARAERIRFLRIKAEEARLELLALEQMEKEELDMRQAPELQRSKGDVASSSVSDPDSLRVSKMRPRSQQPTSGSAFDKPPLYHPPMNLQLAPERPQDHHSSLSRCQSTVRRGRLEFCTAPKVMHPTRSLGSPLSSPSPPVSPLHSAQITSRRDSISSDEEASTITARRVHMAHLCARRSTLDEVRKCARSSRLQRLQPQRDDDFSDRLLQDHLQNCQEDLLDTTLSEMMHRHLVLLSDKDDTDISDGRQESSDIDSPDVFSEDVPSLLTETMLENGSGDLSFIIEKPMSFNQPSPRATPLPLLTIPIRPSLLTSMSPASDTQNFLSSKGSQQMCSDSETGSPASEYSSAKEEFFPDTFTCAIRTPSSPDGLLLAAPNPSVNTKESMNRHLLDLIIIRPPNKDPNRYLDEHTDHFTSGDSSPWSDLCSDASTPSSTSTSSSWSWSWPSTITNSADGSGAHSSSDEHHHVRSMHSKSTGKKNVAIKSRSLSSLIRHGNGWLGFQSLDLRLVASGQYHIVAVMQANQVYSCWEANDNGGQGRGGCAVLDPQPEDCEVEETLGRCVTLGAGTGFAQDTAAQRRLVHFQGQDTLPSRVMKVVCSNSATFLMTENGDLWGWGTFKDSLGNAIGLIDKKIAPRPILICPQSVKDVVCGHHHVLILSKSGDVISWGVNDRGQLGRQVSSSPTPNAQLAADLSPFFIAGLPPNILGIGAGKVCSFAWDKDRLYGWGDNTFGQLGALSSRTSGSQAIVSTPRGLSLHWKGKSIKQVQGGAQHTVILTYSGLVMTMGNNNVGQLGVSSITSSSTSHPVSPQDFYGSDASALSSPEETVDANSKKREGLISPSTATSKSSVRLFPALVRIGQGVKEISCGDHHTATCGYGGEMFLWGQGYDGILSIHSTIGNKSRGPVNSSNEPVRDRARKVVAVSTMRRGVSIALVSH